MPGIPECKIVAMTRPNPEVVGQMATIWVETWSIAMPAIDFASRRDWFVKRAGEWPLTLLARTPGNRLTGFALLDPALQRLDQLAVAPSAYGTGTAWLLMERIKQECGDRIHLDVNTDNSRAVRFYEREGFKVTGTGINERSGLATLAMTWCAPSHGKTRNS
jgi:putative acetyltransferase